MRTENTQPCGHPASLLLYSAETKEPLYCEACDDKSGRRDAEARETELTLANQVLRERIEALEAEVAGLKRDAERYRWLRDVNTDGEIIFDYSAPSPGVFVFRVNFDGEPIESDEEMAIRLDAAIDAAMKGQS